MLTAKRSTIGSEGASAVLDSHFRDRRISMRSPQWLTAVLQALFGQVIVTQASDDTTIDGAATKGSIDARVRDRRGTEASVDDVGEGRPEPRYGHGPEDRRPGCDRPVGSRSVPRDVVGAFARRLGADGHLALERRHFFCRYVWDHHMRLPRGQGVPDEQKDLAAVSAIPVR
jgi:hypothetical protein